MKKSLVILTLLLCFPFIAPAEDASRTPPVTIHQALDLAEKYMADNGLQGKVFIYSIALERASFLTSKQFWTVTWSAQLPGSSPQKRELGLKIEMDGTLKRLVKEHGAAKS